MSSWFMNFLLKDMLELKIDQCRNLKKELNKMKQKQQFYKNLDQKKREIENLKRECACAKRNEAIEHHDNKVKELDRVKSKIATCKESIDKEADKKDALCNERGNVETQLEKNQNEGENVKNCVMGLRADVRNAKNELKKATMTKVEFINHMNTEVVKNWS